MASGRRRGGPLGKGFFRRRPGHRSRPRRHEKAPGLDPRLAARFAFVTGDTLGGGLTGDIAATGVPLVDKPFQPREIRELATRIAGEPG